MDFLNRNTDGNDVTAIGLEIQFVNRQFAKGKKNESQNVFAEFNFRFDKMTPDKRWR